MLKKIITRMFIIVIFFSSPFIVLTSFDFSIQGTYSKYYYAELSDMYERLKEEDNKKIVVIGNSNVSFGLESKLFEELMEDYSVVNFGLYGSIGTKAMLELAKNYINKDDIVILVPEEYSQSMSLYFSATEFWYALDSNRSMFNDLDSKSKKALIGNYTDYVSKKIKEKNNKDFNGFGVYSKASFDENCDLTNYPRDYNIMFNDYDENNPIDLTKLAIDDSFIDYVNEYSSFVESKGAKMYYSFSPMNEKSIINTKEEINEFYNNLREKLNFPIISDINHYIMDSGWFYDSNFHLNSSGMKLRTYFLVEDLKNEIGNTTKTNYIVPDMPIKPSEDIVGEGDNSSKDYFVYERSGNYYKIVGLTEEGLEQEELIIPYQVDGLYINEFSNDVFSYNKKIKKIIIQKNIKRIYDNSFYGAESLQGVYLLHDSPQEISVGFNLLVGTATMVYVDENIKITFINDYFWGAYQGRILGYEKN